MKRIVEHPEEPTTGKRYWRSVGEFEGTDEFAAGLEREFPDGVSEMTGEEADESRRTFMKLMGASTAMASMGLASCRRPEKHILPYANHVEWIIPGKPLFYATAMPTADGCTPLVATVHEGRPTFLQGNPIHPVSNGSADSFATASILDLYDPDRIRDFAVGGKASTAGEFDAFVAKIASGITKGGGDGVGILVDRQTSPTRNRLLNKLRKSSVRIYEHEAISRSNHVTASEAVFGAGSVQNRRIDLADKVLSLDCDFLGLERLGSKSVGDFSSRRHGDEGDMNRLYVVEPNYTVTGGMADHRLPSRAADIVFVAAKLAQAIGKVTGSALPASLAGLVKGGIDEATQEWVDRTAEDLSASKGKALVVVGSQQPLAVQALAIAMNAALDAYGKTIHILKGDISPKADDLKQLGNDARDGKISSLFILGSNPGFASPADLDWASIQAQVPDVICLADTPNDTCVNANWVAPKAHYLESWGDVRSADGTYSLIQPMILPLFGGLSQIDVLLMLLGEKSIAPVEIEEGDPEPDDRAFLAVKETFSKASKSAFDVTLKDGFAMHSGYQKIADGAGKLNAGAVKALIARADSHSAPASGGFEVVLTPDSHVWDGRYINNSTLQETPDPITKLTWDNCALMSPRTFRQVFDGIKLKTPGFETPHPMISVTLEGGQQIEIPVMEAPGHAHNSISISLGYGQKTVGQVGAGTGFDAYALQTSANPYFSTGATVAPSGGSYLLATTAEHYSIEGRAIIRDARADEMKAETETVNAAIATALAALPEGATDVDKQIATKKAVDDNAELIRMRGIDSHAPKNKSLYHGQIGRKTEENPDGFDYETEHQWGMTIDLNQCIGCTACTVACTTENNIPIVGKSQVIQNREMHWIRMDRYFVTSDTVDGDPPIEELDNPEMIPQPVACVHCESAPCETVCPVNATVHTPEGLNAMAYNRCIGTRYCANNCPYKARRFNFFDYNKRNPLTKEKLPVIGEYNNLKAGPIGARGDKGDRGILDLQKNPNVTVRMRGVMEKCTYCVQRLEESKIQQKIVAKGSAKTRVPTDSVKTACQQACPAEAITFGDMGDPAAMVNKLKMSPRNYDLLNYIGTYPRTSYLARIKNPNPKMPDQKRIGHSTPRAH